MSDPKITFRRRPEGYIADAYFQDGRNYHAIADSQPQALEKLALFWMAQERGAEAVSCENGVNSETPDPINVQYQDARRPY